MASGNEELNFVLIFIGVYLLYNIVLVSAIQQSESALYIHVFSLSWTSLLPSTCSYPIHLGHYRILNFI